MKVRLNYELQIADAIYAYEKDIMLSQFAMTAICSPEGALRLDGVDGFFFIGGIAPVIGISFLGDEEASIDLNDCLTEGDYWGVFLYGEEEEAAKQQDLVLSVLQDVLGEPKITPIFAQGSGEA